LEFLACPNVAEPRSRKSKTIKKYENTNRKKIVPLLIGTDK